MNILLVVPRSSKLHKKKVFLGLNRTLKNMMSYQMNGRIMKKKMKIKPMRKRNIPKKISI